MMVILKSPGTEVYGVSSACSSEIASIYLYLEYFILKLKYS